MSGSKLTSMTRAELASARAAGQSRTAVAQVQAASPYVWDGVDEDDRPLSREEMQAGIEAAAGRRRGRPAGGDKESTTIRLDRDILNTFRAAGPGWQTRINAALREWLDGRVAAGIEAEGKKQDLTP